MGNGLGRFHQVRKVDEHERQIGMMGTKHDLMSQNTDMNQQVSDLMDGRLRGSDFAKAVQAVADNASGRETWHGYHLIGDVLRGGDTALAVGSVNLVEGVFARLALEADATRVPTDPVAHGLSPVVGRKAGLPANDGLFRWRMLAGMASLTAVLAVGWNMVGGSSGGSGQLVKTESAPQTGAVVAGSASAASLAPPVMIRDPHLDALLAAHKQFGGTSALQMPAGFIRNATFEGGSR